MKPPIGQLVEGLGLTIKKFCQELGYQVVTCNHNGGFATDEKGNLCKDCFGLGWKAVKAPSEDPGDSPSPLALRVEKLEESSPSIIDQHSLILGQMSLRVEKLEDLFAKEEVRLDALELGDEDVKTDPADPSYIPTRKN